MHCSRCSGQKWSNPSTGEEGEEAVRVVGEEAEGRGEAAEDLVGWDSTRGREEDRGKWKTWEGGSGDPVEEDAREEAAGRRKKASRKEENQG